MLKSASGRAEEGEVEACVKLIPSPSGDCTVLGEWRKVFFREIYQAKWIMPIAASQSHATWEITCSGSTLVFFVSNKKIGAN